MYLDHITSPLAGFGLHLHRDANLFLLLQGHVFGKSTRKEFCYDNLHISRNAWDTNLVKVNPEFIAVNWESSGGGAFAVIPLSERGKAPDQIPLFRGHTAAVLDTDWNPFNDYLIASASDDGKVFLWQVPQDFTLHVDAEEIPSVSPVGKLTGHARKVGQVCFNPAAENILASASGDFTVKIWDVGAGSEARALHIGDVVQSLSWSADGTMLVTTSRDKKLRVWDVRQQKPVHEHPGHGGAKNSRAVWMGEHNRIATTGFSRMSDRQIALWEPGNPKPIGGFHTVDSISGVCMPFWDDGSNCLYLAGKGDGNIRYFEYANDKFEFLAEYKSAEPQRGVAFLPRRGVNVHENEVMRAYKTVNDTYIEPISFTVPRRAETFQADIFPPAVGLKPGVSAKEYFDGKAGIPPKIDLESVYEGAEPVEIASNYKPTPVLAPAPVSAPDPSKPVAKPEPSPAPRSPPTVTDQKASMAAMVDKYKDDDDDGDDDDADEISSFEEVSRPAQRAAAPAAAPVKAEPRPASPVKATSPTITTSKAPSPIKTSKAPAAGSSQGDSAEVSKLISLVESQTKLLLAQDSKINRLIDEVDKLQKASAVAASQGEKIRQIELQLEAIDS
ncbi:hypothetical protein MKZ38_002960 [Zalerion maritima]|uniref:Coronin n=1 Tax=Zalerion maritima TaxID=339359 RepID=A0AAD5WSN6_9PEZI|nr:hypothetical protein MKZ38_002960 [Zalerion maritima]